MENVDRSEYWHELLNDALQWTQNFGKQYGFRTGLLVMHRMEWKGVVTKDYSALFRFVI